MQVNGVIMPPDGPDCWPDSDSKKQWLVFYRLDGFTLNGTGTIEGNGNQWWDLPCKPHRVIYFFSLKPFLVSTNLEVLLLIKYTNNNFLKALSSLTQLKRLS